MSQQEEPRPRFARRASLSSSTGLSRRGSRQEAATALANETSTTSAKTPKSTTSSSSNSISVSTSGESHVPYWVKASTAGSTSSSSNKSLGVMTVGQHESRLLPDGGIDLATPTHSDSGPISTVTTTTPTATTTPSSHKRRSRRSSSRSSSTSRRHRSHSVSSTSHTRVRDRRLTDLLNEGMRQVTARAGGSSSASNTASATTPRTPNRRASVSSSTPSSRSRSRGHSRSRRSSDAGHHHHNRSSSPWSVRSASGGAHQLPPYLRKFENQPKPGEHNHHSSTSSSSSRSSRPRRESSAGLTRRGRRASSALTDLSLDSAVSSRIAAEVLKKMASSNEADGSGGGGGGDGGPASSAKDASEAGDDDGTQVASPIPPVISLRASTLRNIANRHASSPLSTTSTSMAHNTHKSSGLTGGTTTAAAATTTSTASVSAPPPPPPPQDHTTEGPTIDTAGPSSAATINTADSLPPAQSSVVDEVTEELLAVDRLLEHTTGLTRKLETFSTANTKLQAQVSDLQEQTDTLQLELTAVTKLVDTKQIEVDATKTALDSARVQLAASANERLELMEGESALKAQISQLQAEAEVSHHAKMELNRVCNQVQARMMAELEKRQAAEADVKRGKNLLKQFESENKALEKRVASRDVEIKSLEDQLEAAKDERHGYELQVHKLQEEQLEMRSMLEDTKDVMGKQLATIDVLRKECSDMRTANGMMKKDLEKAVKAAEVATAAAAAAAASTTTMSAGAPPHSSLTIETHASSAGVQASGGIDTPHSVSSVLSTTSSYAHRITQERDEIVELIEASKKRSNAHQGDIDALCSRLEELEGEIDSVKTRRSSRHKHRHSSSSSSVTASSRQQQQQHKIDALVAAKEDAERRALEQDEENSALAARLTASDQMTEMLQQRLQELEDEVEVLREAGAAHMPSEDVSSGSPRGTPHMLDTVRSRNPGFGASLGSVSSGASMGQEPPPAMAVDPATQGTVDRMKNELEAAWQRSDTAEARVLTAEAEVEKMTRDLRKVLEYAAGLKAQLDLQQNPEQWMGEEEEEEEDEEDQHEEDEEEEEVEDGVEHEAMMRHQRVSLDAVEEEDEDEEEDDDVVEDEEDDDEGHDDAHDDDDDQEEEEDEEDEEDYDELDGQIRFGDLSKLKSEMYHRTAAPPVPSNTSSPYSHSMIEGK